jgi:hypothetical protein
MLECAGVGYRMKYDVNQVNPRLWGPRDKLDKTYGQNSRPGAKQTIRNANRALTKRARQLLKRALMVDVVTALW